MNQTLEISLIPGKKVYFVSDIHFGEPNYEATRARERKVIRWIESVESEAQAFFFNGDTFDFWFEYQTVVPKGYVRFLAKIASLVEKGIPVYVFTGNHDLWMRDYLEKELGAKVFKEKLLVNAADKKIFIAHGDGLGPSDTKYKLLKKIFTNPVCIWLFSWLHPDIGTKIASAWSRNSRKGHALDKFKGADKEWLVAYSKRKLETAHYDYFIFGHRHIPFEHSLNEYSKFINLGDWIINNSYAVFDGKDIELKYFEKD